MKISTKMFLAVSTVVIIALLIVGVGSVSNLDRAMTRMSNRENTINTSYVKSQIENILSPKATLIEGLATTAPVKDFDFELLADSFIEILKTHPDILNIYLAPSYERAFFVMTKVGDRIYEDTPPEGFDARTRDWYRNAQTLQKTTFTTPYIDTGTGSLVFTISTPIKDKNGFFAGVMGVDVSLDTMKEFLTGVTIGESGHIFMVDASGSIIFHNDEGYLFTNVKDYLDEETAQQVLSGTSGAGVATVGGELYNVFFEPVDLTGWSLATVIPQEELRAPLRSAIQNVMIGIGITVLTVGLITLPVIRGNLKPLGVIVEQLEEIAAGGGDLTRRLDVKNNDEVGKLAAAFNNFLDTLSSLIGEVKQSADAVLEGIKQLSYATDQQAKTNEQIAMVIGQVAEGSQNQSADIHHAQQTINQLVSAINQVATGIQNQAVQTDNVANLTKSMIDKLNETLVSVDELTEKQRESKVLATNGLQVVNEFKDNMEKVHAGITENAELAVLLDEGSTQIGAIVKVINEVADQTNLLALNAAIEAARAGEHGRGFAVVADEVRTLSDRVRSSSNEIGEIVKKLTKTIEQTVHGQESGMELAQRGTELAAQAQKALAKIVRSATESGRMLEKIAHLNEELKTQSNEVEEATNNIITIAEQNSASTEQMAASSTEITDLIESIAAVSEENAASSEEVAASAEELSATSEEVSAQAVSLNRITENLKELVANFRTS
ncbi:MAG TPA: methyl-accepting chemotaxis protein [Bacillota bacterium]|nr:methyl-accepting chemotaxis protein [Bacillota bacterium]